MWDLHFQNLIVHAHVEVFVCLFVCFLLLFWELLSHIALRIKKELPCLFIDLKGSRTGKEIFQLLLHSHMPSKSGLSQGKTTSTKLHWVSHESFRDLTGVVIKNYNPGCSKRWNQKWSQIQASCYDVHDGILMAEPKAQHQTAAFYAITFAMINKRLPGKSYRIPWQNQILNIFTCKTEYCISLYI